jgi:hypothetical protein
MGTVPCGGYAMRSEKIKSPAWARSPGWTWSWSWSWSWSWGERLRSSNRNPRSLKFGDAERWDAHVGIGVSCTSKVKKGSSEEYRVCGARLHVLGMSLDFAAIAVLLVQYSSRHDTVVDRCCMFPSCTR